MKDYTFQQVAEMIPNDSIVQSDIHSSLGYVPHWKINLAY